MSEETTTDRLAEIEGQAEPQPVQVREGRWRTRNGEIRHVTRTPDDLSDEGRYLWHDAEHCQTWYDNGRYFHEKEHPLDLVEYLGPIQQQPEQTITPDDVAAEALTEPQPVHLQAMIEAQAETISRLHSEIHGLNMEIGGLQAQLEAVKAELVRQCENSRLLQIELDAREQVPADLPQLQQLRADLAEASRDRDTYRHAHELLVQDINATHLRTKVMAVETIAEWLEPIRTCGRQGLSLAVIQALPHIMRSLTGIAEED